MGAPLILVGMSGWSYEEWVGPFYPVSLRSEPSEWLPFYATRFRSVEINSTFHAFPSPELVADWARRGVELVERAGSPFEFSLKLPRVVTHDALPEGDVERAREVTGEFDRLVLDPLAGEELLGAVLVQLPPGFGASETHVAAVHEVVAALAERQVAIEFRDASWYRNGCLVDLADPLFASRDVCAVELDTGGRRLTPLTPGRARHAYVRLHGRKYDLLAHGPASGADLPGGLRYDYLYDRSELTPWAERARDLQERRREARVFFNNTYGAKGTVNALQLLDMLGMAPPVPRPRLTEQTRLHV